MMDILFTLVFSSGKIKKEQKTQRRAVKRDRNNQKRNKGNG